MANVLVIYAHPGQRFSRANRAMAQAARAVGGLSFVDLYAEYPRYDIDVEREQARLLAHDVIVFQFPLYWYSTPSLLKEWQDLVLQYGFAYGSEGKALAGKTMALAITTGGPETAYAPGGHNNHDLRAFLVPLQQTAALCQMHFADPFVLFGALAAKQDPDLAEHAAAYARYLTAIRDDTAPLADTGGLMTAETFQARPKAEL